MSDFFFLQVNELNQLCVSLTLYNKITGKHFFEVIPVADDLPTDEWVTLYLTAKNTWKGFELQAGYSKYFLKQNSTFFDKLVYKYRWNPNEYVIFRASDFENRLKIRSFIIEDQYMVMNVLSFKDYINPWPFTDVALNPIYCRKVPDMGVMEFYMIISTCDCSSPNCNQCIYGYYFNTTSGECNQCGINCLSCTNANTCMELEKVNNLNEESNTSTIKNDIVCKAGYVYEPIENYCSKCPSLCLSCDLANNCYECEKSATQYSTTCKCDSGEYIYGGSVCVSKWYISFYNLYFVLPVCGVVVLMLVSILIFLRVRNLKMNRNNGRYLDVANVKLIDTPSINH